ncbi:putative phytanoyl-CoA dioxygenase [Planktothrix tepida]|uniref:Phytanoyl-CoA dioxygenase n=2 Tax=Planktothrix TaxID=54304 RepID=A0A1J1LR67_9CYAN|nr:MULTISPECIES: phytanoyl-CoA dioxygenase family protein [Planktothrix]CAD5944215.1 putative phytanoyl-CoA dioxygenase [Planktothrix pseudagardhii]CAD5966594.1 putative phytanoyl-CoA dioxygenase [Planktothrix tepida]CUR35080.1 conserved hypothetical protein [Planktothrix tepida PCC 9214]
MVNQINSHETNRENRNREEISTTHPLSPEQIAEYHAEGFVIVRGFFDPEELEPLQLACEEDPEIKGTQTSVTDHLGRTFKVATWTDLGNAMLGVIPRIARIVDAAEALLGMECYHWHSKLLRKQPHTDSVVNFHQDYWFWYYDGCLFPQLLTCTIAIDKNTKENGCLQIVKKSHLLGRLDQVSLGNDYGTEPERLEKILERLEIVHCELEPGDALFFHANTLHGSGSNYSDLPRTLIHCTYNAVSNSPFLTEGQEHHRYRPLHKLPDSILTDGGYDSIFTKHEFHAVETENGVGAGIFRRYPTEKKLV